MITYLAGLIDPELQLVGRGAYPLPEDDLPQVLGGGVVSFRLAEVKTETEGSLVLGSVLIFKLRSLYRWAA